MSAGTELLSESLAQRHPFLTGSEAVLVILMNIAGLLGNTLVFCVAYRNRRNLRITDLLIVALSTTDLLVALTVMPLTTAALITGRWPFSRSLCLFQGFCVISFATASLGTLSVIALNRYYCVVKPNKYREVFSVKNTLGYIALVFSLPCSFSVPPLVFGRDDYTFQPGKVLCLYPFEINIAYTVCLDVLFIAVPSIFIGFCYWRVFRTVQGRNRVMMSGSSNDFTATLHVQEANVTKTLVAVLVGFAFCWLPVLVMDTIDIANGSLILPRQLYLFYTYMVFLSSTINPMIYALFNKRFRREYLKIWHLIRAHMT